MRVYAEATITENVYVDGIGLLRMIYSIESSQDPVFYYRAMCSKRTAPITDAEIKDWQQIYEILKKCDPKETIKKYKMRFFREEEPYQWMGTEETPDPWTHYDCDDGFRHLQLRKW